METTISLPENVRPGLYLIGMEALEALDEYLDGLTSVREVRNTINSSYSRFNDFYNFTAQERSIELPIFSLRLSTTDWSQEDRILQDRNRLAEALNQPLREN